ncbi:MAG: hypothetical protein AAF456_20785 [Planctomycetota bacterium]
MFKQHRIIARITGELPEIPEGLKDDLEIRRQGDRIQIVDSGSLSVVLKWLAGADLEDVYIQPLGLRAVYDRFHRTDLVYGDDDGHQKGTGG